MKRIICLLFVLLLTACSTVTTQEVPKYELGKSENVPLTEEEYFQELQSANGGTSSEKSQTNIDTNVQTGSENSSSNNYSSENGKRTVTVRRVIDSDTLVVEDGNREITLRLLGINGPEYTKTKQAFGSESTQFLTDLVLGQTIEIEPDANADLTDRYGRYLVHAAIGGKSIQQILLMEGLVRVAYLYGNYKYVDMYKEAESIAQDAGLNIWSIPGYVDSKNGFNMDVITEDIADQLTGELKEELSDKLLEKVSELQKLIK